GEISVDTFSFIILETIFYTFFLAYMFGAMARERIAHRYKQAALTDPLTGVPNRRDFVPRCEAQLLRSSFEQRPSVLLLLDLDNFKSVNDIDGHHVGDRVLREFAQTVASALRPTDIFARLGGEEFGALVPGASLEEGLDIAERIRARVAAAPLEVEQNAIGVTVSVGVAGSPGPDEA